MKINEMSFNQIRGRVCASPELKEVKENKKVLVFSLSYLTSQSADSSGSHTNFIKVEAWDKLAEIFQPILVNGLEIIIHGNLVQNRWKDKENKQHSYHKLVASSITVTDLKFKGIEKAA